MIEYLKDYYSKLIQNKITPKNEESLIDVHSPLFEPFSEEDLSHIPHYSINREFIGGSIFDY